MAVFMTDEEQQKVNAFKAENKMKWESQQRQLEMEATHKGEAFTPTEYVEVSDENALMAVRNGWKSGLDKLFEQKRKRDLSRGIEWGKPFKIK